MHPDIAPPWWHIGRAKEEDGDRKGAILAYSRSLDANPRYGQLAEPKSGRALGVSLRGSLDLWSQAFFNVVQ